MTDRQPLTREHLGPREPWEAAPDSPRVDDAARMAQYFETMHAEAEAREQAALGRWVAGIGFAAALLIGALA